MTVLPKIQINEELLGACFGFFVTQSVNRTNHQQMFPDGQRLKEGEVLRQNADSLLNFNGRVDNGTSANKDFAAGRPQNSGEHSDGCGFARAVCSQKAKQRSFRNPKLEIAYGSQIAKRLR